MAVQPLDLGFIFLSGFLPVIKNIGGALKKSPFPAVYHCRVDPKSGSKLGNPFLVSQRLQGNFGLKFRFVMGSFFAHCHLLSWVDSAFNTLFHFFGTPQWDCKYHVVLVPKYRKRVLYGSLKREFGGVLRDLAIRKGVDIERCNLWKTKDAAKMRKIIPFELFSYLIIHFFLDIFGDAGL